MILDDLRCIAAIVLKDLRAYYFKPPNISWGMLFPFAFLLAFSIRSPGDLKELVPGLLALTLLFGATSMEAIVITFERRIGALERLLLAPMRLPALLLGKLLEFSLAAIGEKNLLGFLEPFFRGLVRLESRDQIF